VGGAGFRGAVGILYLEVEEMDLRCSPRGRVYVAVDRRFTGVVEEVLIAEVFPVRRGGWWVDARWWRKLAPVELVPRMNVMLTFREKEE